MRTSGLLLALMLLAACSGMAGGSRAGAISGGIVAEVNRAAAGLTAPPQGDEAAPLSDDALIAMGRQLYASNCAPCHQPNGEGTLSLFPALNRNAFVTVSDPTGVIDTVLHGREIMPAFASTLSDREVAAVISYIRNAWNNQAPVLDESHVREVREGAR
ncbi:MAG: cytochrome c [Caldilineaceae bacterium]|nr:cytochrome c [Caldilineaceae bacterium]